MASPKYKVGDVLHYYNRDDHRFLVIEKGEFTGRILADAKRTKEISYVLKNLDYEKNHCSLIFNCTEQFLVQRKIKDTKIARKIYPHYRKDGEYLICREKIT